MLLARHGILESEGLKEVYVRIVRKTIWMLALVTVVLTVLRQRRKSAGSIARGGSRCAPD
jgi:hypothetical protein